MSDFITTTRNVDFSSNAGTDGLYSAVLSAREDIGDGNPVRIRDLDLTDYLNHGVVLLNHASFGNALPVGHTEDIRVDDQGRLVARFRFLEDNAVADEVRNAWDQGVVRSASISFRTFPDGKQSLIEWSIVTLPADVEAVARSVRKAANQEESVVEEVKENENVGSESQLDALIKRMDILEKSVSDLHEVVTARGEAKAEDVEAAEEAPQVEESSDEERSAHTDEGRMELLHTFEELLPKERSADLTERDILVLAVGDTVADVSSRDNSYLLAKAEGILEERQAAKKAIASVTPNDQTTMISGRVDDIMFNAIRGKL